MIEFRLHSFNPCSLGCCSESMEIIHRYVTVDCVSILVLLDVALKVFLGEPTWIILKDVSILVLLDVALKEVIVKECAHCSVVSILVLLDVALKEPLGQYRQILQRVSILVLLDVALKENLYRFIVRINTKFQSLFSWMLLWKKVLSAVTFYWWLFQSLFSWMLLWKPKNRLRKSAITSVSILVLLDVALKVYRELQDS